MKAKKVHHYEKNVTTPRPNVMLAPQVSRNLLKDVYGPGNDNYGRDKSPWEKEKYDKCVNCGNLTEYTKDTPIDYRMNYVEGAGQLCEKCYNEIYKNS